MGRSPISAKPADRALPKGTLSDGRRPPFNAATSLDWRAISVRLKVPISAGTSTLPRPSRNGVPPKRMQTYRQRGRKQQGGGLGNRIASPDR
jgi:hypothetical protein